MASATVRDVMSHEFVAVSESDDLDAVAELMLSEGAESIVVLRGSEPVGTVTERDLVAMAVRGSITETSAADAMGTPPPIVTSDRPIEAAIDAMTTEDVRALVVADDDGVVGLLSRSDIVAASASLPANEFDTESQTTGIAVDAFDGELVAEEPEGSAQGVCEDCGSLTRDLRTVNGRMLCVDCARM